MDCRFCLKKDATGQHVARCRMNPERKLGSGFKGKIVSAEMKRKISNSKLGISVHSNENKKQISERMKISNPSFDQKVRNKISSSMKKAHAEGRAWNIGKSRWNNEPSYPEKFFMEVIENEFNNQDYIREFPFGKFSLDFAWLNLKRCIEIDGEYHQLDEQKRRDKEKNVLLKENGWKILRISWKDMMKDSKNCISKAKEFIDIPIGVAW